MKKLRRRFGQLILTIGVAVLVTAIIVQPAGQTDLTAGQVSPDTYRAPRTVTYQSDIRTREAQARVTETVPAIYRTDLTATSQQTTKTDATLTRLAALRAAGGTPESRFAEAGQLLANASQNELRTVLTVDEGSWQAATTATRGILAQLQQGRVTQDDLAKGRQLVESRLPANLAEPARSVTVTLGRALLLPNYLLDEAATEEARNRLRDTVEPVGYTVERDQVIVGRGQVLTDFDVERLAAVGLTRPAFGWQKSIGILILATLLTAALLRVVPRLSRRLRYPRRQSALLSGMAVLVALAGVIAVPLQPILAYVAPVAAGGVLLTLFYGYRAGLLGGVIISVLYAVAAGLSFELLFIHLTATVGAVLAARRLTTTGGFLTVGAAAGLLTFLGVSAFSLLSGNFDPAALPKFALAAALQGALVASFVFAGAAFLGGLLGIVTFFQLLELENPRQPLLRKLAREAPGTYSHSLRIAGWVETLAESVGADPLLARVQALYHDVGKSNLPEYFVENQPDPSIHGNLSPKESAEILRSHISEGLALAAHYRVPEAVARAIPEHHGTFLMGFFWATARKRSTSAKQADYRYLGPTPRSKETAILMLADAVEASSRTISRPSEAAFTKLVQKIMNERIADGQLDEAPLSTREMTTLRRVFVERLLTDAHKRVKYPGAK